MFNWDRRGELLRRVPTPGVKWPEVEDKFHLRSAIAFDLVES